MTRIETRKDEKMTSNSYKCLIDFSFCHAEMCFCVLFLHASHFVLNCIFLFCHPVLICHSLLSFDRCSDQTGFICIENKDLHCKIYSNVMLKCGLFFCCYLVLSSIAFCYFVVLSCLSQYIMYMLCCNSGVRIRQVKFCINN